MIDPPELKYMVLYQAIPTHDLYRATEAVLKATGALTALNDDDRFRDLLDELRRAVSCMQRAYTIRGPIEPHLFTAKDATS